jgi:hypothetical protein
MRDKYAAKCSVNGLICNQLGDTQNCSSSNDERAKICFIHELNLFIDLKSKSTNITRNSSEDFGKNNFRSLSCFRLNTTQGILTSTLTVKCCISTIFYLFTCRDYLTTKHSLIDQNRRHKDESFQSNWMS